MPFGDKANVKLKMINESQSQHVVGEFFFIVKFERHDIIK